MCTLPCFQNGYIFQCVMRDRTFHMDFYCNLYCKYLINRDESLVQWKGLKYIKLFPKHLKLTYNQVKHALVLNLKKKNQKSGLSPSIRGRRVICDYIGYLEAWPEGEEGVHEVPGVGQGFVHMDVDHHWALTNVSHHRVVMLREKKVHSSYLKRTCYDNRF